MSLSAGISGAPGRIRRREEVPVPAAYAVFDCETTGTNPRVDEIVSLAALRLGPAGVEKARITRLVRPTGPIPAEATAVHGISDADVRSAPRFSEIAPELFELFDGAVFVGHNARFDLVMVQRAFARAGIDYRPVAVACTLDAVRLLDPCAENHRLETVCERRGIVLASHHEALSDVLATAALLRAILYEGYAPETVWLDQSAFLRIRARGDTRLATDPQIRRVFGLARSAELLLPSGAVDRAEVVALVQRVAGTEAVESLTREQVQDVYDALETLIAAKAVKRAA